MANLERYDPRSHRLTCVDLATGRERYSLPCHLIYAMTMASDERWFAFSRNDDVEVIDLETGELRHRLTGHTTSIREIDFSPDGRFLASASDDRTVRFWRHNSGHAVDRIPVPGGFIKDIEFDPGGETLAVVNARADVVLIHARRGNE